MGVSDPLVLIHSRWLSSLELGLLSPCCFLPICFDDFALEFWPIGRSLFPERGSVLFSVPAVLIYPCEFPGVETASVRQGTAFIVLKPSNSNCPSFATGP